MRTIRPGIAAIEQPMPGHPLVATNCYLIATDTGAIVVDPGYERADFIEGLELGLRAIDRRPGTIQTVLLTHNHRDHSESAGMVRELTGAAVALHPQDWWFAASRILAPELVDAWGVPKEVRGRLLNRRIPDGADADLELVPGLELPTTNGPLRVVHTPGHTAGSVCLVMDDAGLIFTGDHVLPDLHPGAGVGGHFTGNPLREFLASLDAMDDFAGYVGQPGHGAVMADVPGRAREIAEHHRRRGREIADVLAQRPDATVWEVAESVRWSGGFHALEAGRMVSALRQTSWHAELAREHA